MTALVVPRLDPTSAEARLTALLDDAVLDTSADGVVLAAGRLDGAPAMAYATDQRVQGGALGSEGCMAIAQGIDRAAALGQPVIGVWHSGGARLGEGVASLDGVAHIFSAMTRASGTVPQISLVLGAAAGGAAYGPALTDLVVMGPAGRVFVTGPDVVRSVTGENVGAEELGGPDTHARSGVAHIAADSESTAIEWTRALTGLLAARRVPATLAPEADPGMAALLPANPRRAYDVHPIVGRLFDAPPIELHAKWGRNIVTSLGRLAGRSVGVLANNPIRLGGCLDATAAEKAARFVQMCDAFGLPLIVVVDVPGYLPGVRQEHEGVVRRGAKLLHAFAAADVPRITLVTRKAYGGAYIAMNSRGLGATAVLAWPTAEMGVMGASAAVGILHRRTLAAVEDGEVRALEQARLADEYTRTAGGLDAALALGLVDRVIDPAESRRVIASLLDAAPAHRGRHGNIPL